MELWTGALSWWKCHWPDLKSAGLFWWNLFLNSLKTSTFLVDCLSSGNPVHVDQDSAVKKKGLSKVCGWIFSVRLSWVWESQHASTGNSVSWSQCHSSRSSVHHMAFFPSLKQNFIAYRSSKVADCIFEIHQPWQSGFSRVYSNYCRSCSLDPEIIRIGQSSHNIYSNNIVNSQESTTILNACTKKSGNLLKAPYITFNFLLDS